MVDVPIGQREGRVEMGCAKGAGIVAEAAASASLSQTVENNMGLIRSAMAK